MSSRPRRPRLLRAIASGTPASSALVNVKRTPLAYLLGALATLTALGTPACGEDTAPGGSGGTGAAPTTGGTSGNTGGSGGDSVTTGGAGGTGGSTTSGYSNLSETGLYEADMTTLAAGVMPYEPQFQLWSDAAAKQRWIYVPAGEQIDTSDMDSWDFPVGTKLWKEFSRSSVRVETRLLEKLPDGTWRRNTFIWNDAQSDAEYSPLGQTDAKGTAHDVPTEEDCRTCHSGTDAQVLGFSAIQLSHDGDGTTLGDLIADDLLSDPPAGNFVIPGTDTEVAAFGYLHANCGTCHNPESNTFLTIDMDLSLRTTDLGPDPTTMAVYETTVGVPISLLERNPPDASHRITADNLTDSALYVRMNARGEEWDMPQLGTEDVDTAGAALVAAWISSL